MINASGSSCEEARDVLRGGGVRDVVGSGDSRGCVPDEQVTEVQVEYMRAVISN